jgi:hypothetical protein
MVPKLDKRVREELVRRLGDDLANTWFWMSDYSYEEMLEEHGESGKSRFDVLQGLIFDEQLIRRTLAALDEEED